MKMDLETVKALLPERKASSHKGDYGKAVLLCGSRGYTGAPAMAAMGALRIGTGLVWLGVPKSIYKIEALKMNEAIVTPLGSFRGSFAGSIPQKLLADKDAVLFGCGCGQRCEAFFLRLMKQYQGPLVLDADGINLIASHKDILRGRTGPTVLTPHEGEFRRLGGDLTKGRQQAAADMARDLHCIVVLKGHETVITDGEVCYINPTGNPGLATGGSGDVLAGMITGLLAQHLSPLEAAVCGAYLHGGAADLCAQRLGMCAMLPTDILEDLPRLLK